MRTYSRILVTGGAGFIGSHLVDRLIKENTEVVVLDNLQSGRLENIDSHKTKRDFQFVRGDIRDFELVKKLVKDVDAVFHLAAIVSVPQSVENPIFVNDVNVNGTLNLLKAAADSGVRRFVNVSSCAVYGESTNPFIKENAPMQPLSPYATSKLTAESYARVFCKIFGLGTVSLRYFNVFGPGQAYGDYSGVITHFMKRAEENSELTIFGDGQQTRDFVHVHDIVEANILALKTQGIEGKTFNIGTGIATTINHLADTILKVTNKTHLRIKHAAARKGDVKYSTADISQARRKLRYSPQISLKDGITDLARTLRIS